MTVPQETPSPADARPAAPRWARIAAYTAALTPLPTAVWRLALVLGFPAGYTAEGYEDRDITGWGVPAMIMLSVLSVAAALLTLGLVQRWGEVLPRWIPFIGGRAVPATAAAIPAAVGAVILIILWTPFLLWWSLPHDDMTTTGAIVIGILYLPLVAWGPLLAAVTASYWRRRRASNSAR